MTDHRSEDLSPAVLETAEGLRLERPAEPVELRVHLRESALSSHGRDVPTYHDCLSTWLWQQWRATLEPKGFDRERFIDVVTGYRRELWMWLLGDRQWEQLLAGLAGRVSRRVPEAEETT